MVSLLLAAPPRWPRAPPTILVTNLTAINWFKSVVEIGVFFFQGMTSFSFWMINATAASYYFWWACFCRSAAPILLCLLSLGVLIIDPDMIDWLTPAMPAPLWAVNGFTNLKANDVLNPRSTLYLRECQRHPDLEEFLVDVILNTLVAWSNLISPS